MGFVAKERGANALMEEIPALLLVIMGTGLLLSSVVYGYTQYQGAMHDLDMQDECQLLLDSFVCWPEISSQRAGFLSNQRLSQLTDQEIADRFSPDVLGFRYQVLVNDASQYQERIIAALGSHEPPSEGTVYAAWTSAPGLGDDGTVHALQIIAYIWEEG